MVTGEEIRRLNELVQIPILLGQLGCTYEIKPSNGYTEYRTVAWWRDGADNPNGALFAYRHDVRKWIVYDFTGRSVWGIDLIDFMIEALGFSFRKALDLLIFSSGKDNGFGKEVDEYGFEMKPRPKPNEPVPIDPNIYETFNKGLHPYWYRRGYTPEVADYFKLGWSTHGEMKDRLTIPITDEKGRLVSIQGRSMDERTEPKYKFMKGTGDSAQISLYNFRNAYPHALERGWIGITEGATDVWRAHQYGFKNFVGTLSASITKRQIKLIMMLWRMGINAVIMFDYDDTETMAGQIAAVNLGNKLLQEGHEGIYVANIGFHCDPASLTLDQFVMTLKNAVKYQ